MVLGLLGALLVVLQVTMALLPNIEPVSLLVMVYTAVLGRRAAYPIAVFVALEALIWGVSTWVLSYLYVWAVLAVLAWLLRGMESRVGWAVLSGAFGLAFGALCALVYLPVGGWQMFAATWVAGIPFDLLHGAGNFAIAGAVPACRRVLATLCAKVFPREKWSAARRRIPGAPRMLSFAAAVIAAFDKGPVDEAEPGVHVIRPAVLVAQIVGVLPHVHAQKGVLPLDRGQSWLAVWTTDTQREESQTSPGVAEPNCPHGGGLHPGFPVLVGAEGGVHGPGQRAGGAGAAPGGPCQSKYR